MAGQFFIWEGVFPSFAEAKAAAVGSGFAGDIYRERALNAALECLGALADGNPIPAFHKQRSTILPAVAAMMLGSRERVDILDFGGGLGIGYMTLLESLTRAKEVIDYSIVEVAELCEQGRKLFPQDIHFSAELPQERKFDLIHSASALQYVEDWQGMLSVFASYRPDYLLLSDIFAGEIETVATLQNYYNSKIPHWLLNLDELLSVLSDLGFELVMRSFVTSRRLKTDGMLPMENFPPERRLRETLHLLFRRRES